MDCDTQLLREIAKPAASYEARLASDNSDLAIFGRRFGRRVQAEILEWQDIVGRVEGCPRVIESLNEFAIPDFGANRCLADVCEERYVQARDRRDTT